MSNVSISDPVPGTIIDGKYRVESLLGEGGMGKVFRVTHVQLEKTFALKLMHFEHGDTDPNRLTRFKREAEALAKINHPNVVMITDFGVMAQMQLPYIVMEFIEGKTLRQWLVDQGTLSEARAVKIAKHICAGLHEAHIHGVIHRDLKPENIMIKQFDDGDMIARVLDFGIAKLMKKSNEPVGKSITGDEMAGTLKYIPPEQFFGMPIDARADVFAICLILYEMLTGTVPAVMMGRVKTLVDMRPGCTPRLSEIVQKGLSQSPDERPQSAADLKRELESIEHEAVVETVMEQANKSNPRQSNATTVNSGATMFQSVSGDANAAALAPPRRGGAGIYIVIALVVLLAGGGIAAYKMRPEVLEPITGSTSKYKLPDSAIPALVPVKGGKVKIGTAQDEYARPEFEAEVKPFRISKFLVTNRQYAEFVKEAKYLPPNQWQGKEPATDLLEKPVTNVSLRDALAYCQWLSLQTGKAYRLPTEIEWEFVARNKAQIPVDELMTNYLEWTGTKFYLYKGSTLKVPPEIFQTYIFRGRNDEPGIDPVTYRDGQKDSYTDEKLGFRIAADPEN